MACLRAPPPSGFDRGFAEGCLQRLGSGLGGRHIGSTYADGANTLKVPSSFVVDAALRYDLGQLTPQLEGARIGVSVSNLTDKRHTSSCVSAVNCYFGAGRVVTVQMDHRW